VFRTSAFDFGQLILPYYPNNVTLQDST